MPLQEQLYLLATALALGLLVGIERGWQERQAAEGERIAGLRTYGLLGLLGGVCGLLSEEFGTTIVAFGLLGVIILLTAAYIASLQRDQNLGITSMVAALLTFTLGALATLGHVVPAVASAVVTTFLLGYKPQLHDWLKTLQQQELRAALKLLLISLVVLPLLPNRGYGPWQALNPYEIWWMVVLIAGISFIGYFAMKLAGERKGIMLTSLFAGLASSTALTLHFARLGKTRLDLAPYLAAGILVACGTMFPRMLVVATLINPQLFSVLVAPAIGMALVTYGSVAFYWLQRRQQPAAPMGDLENPLELAVALRFGAFLAAIVLLTTALQEYLGKAGIFFMAMISGVADVDAINLSLSRLSNGDLPVNLAAAGIILASAVNSLVKGALAGFIGGKMLALRVALPLIIAAATGLISIGSGYLSAL